MIGVLSIILACSLWAVDTLIRYPLIFGGLSAWTIVFTEHVLLTAIFLPFFIKYRHRIWNAKVSHIFYFVFIGAIGSSMATLAFTKAFALINPSLVILLQKLQPLFAILLARVVLKEKINQQFMIWAFVCLIGGILISYKDLMPLLDKADVSASLLGYGLTMLAVVGWGSSTVFGKKLSLEGYDEKEIMGGRFLFGLLAFLPFLGHSAVSFPQTNLVWGKIALMVGLSGLLGMFFYYQGLKRIPAKLCALAEMFFPFCAISVNWFFLNATLEPIQIVGAGLLLLGSTIIQIKHY
ncbi:MAG: DMT family transporter [Oligoflexia bacterium]|nr:DMT family transporter [Oligoflexia bacterium]